MGNIKLEIYKRIYSHSLSIIKFVRKLPKSTEANILGKQLIRSGTSIAANVLEAKGASSKKDYVNFYNYALKSANESKLWLALIRDTNSNLSLEAKTLLVETVELSNILASSIITMRKNQKKI